MSRGFIRREPERQNLFLHFWHDSESGEHGNAHNTLRHPHLQVEAVQEDDDVGLVAQVPALPLFDALFESADHTRHSALGQVLVTEQRLQGLANPTTVAP